MPVSRHIPFEGIPTPQQLINFFSHVGYDPETGCHPWLGAKGFHQDYPGDLTQAQGRWNYNKRTVTTYRFAMFVELGFQDPGPTVDHLCHNRICVNPLHLRCVPQIENNRNRRPVLSDFCKNGHLRTPESVGINPTTGNRFCRECTKIIDKARYKKRYAKEKKLKTNSSKMEDFARNPKLDEDKVWAILLAYYSDLNNSSRSLARQYQVSSTLIRCIVNGKSWKKVYDKFVGDYPDFETRLN